MMKAMEPIPEPRHAAATRRRHRRWGVGVALIAAAWAIASRGCANWVAHALVDAPNAYRASDEVINLDNTALPEGVNEHLRIDVGPSVASLSAWIMDPKSGVGSDERLTPRATILLLHGIRDSKESQLGFGRALAAAGYRAVLIDLRGHGRSSGRWMTYGVTEARDLSQVLDHLQASGRLAGPVGVLGSSYGGSIGLQLAGIDSRVKAVVAIAPFSHVRDLIRCYARQMNLSWLLTDQEIDEGFRKACELTACDLDRIDSAESAARSTAHVLLIHGRDDVNIPCAHSQRIAAAAGDRAELMLLEGEDHMSIFRDERGVMRDAALDWFARWTASPQAAP